MDEGATVLMAIRLTPVWYARAQFGVRSWGSMTWSSFTDANATGNFDTEVTTGFQWDTLVELVGP